MKKDSKKMEAKMKALEELKAMMMDEDDMGLPESMEKITIASDSKEGLKKGLSKAEEILEKRSKMEDYDEEDMEDYDEEDMEEYSKKMKK